MRKNKNNDKLSLGKRTIAKLDAAAMNQLRGGETSWTCGSTWKDEFGKLLPAKKATKK